MTSATRSDAAWSTWRDGYVERPLVRVLVLAFVALAGVATAMGAGSSALRAVDIAVTVLACVLVGVVMHAASGRVVEALGTVLALLAASSPAATPAATLATLGVARARPLRPAVVVTAASTVSHLVLGAWRPAPHLMFGWWALIVLAVHAALLGWGRSGRAHAQLVASLRARAEAAEAEQQRRVAEARAAERTTIAREMHDVLAHRLSLLATWAAALEYRPDAPPADLARAAGVVRSGVHEALEELRDVIGVLRADDVAPVAERPLPGARDLWRLIEEAGDAGQHVTARVELDDGLGIETVPTAVGRTVFRVVQEALTNARRHAPGQHVDLVLRGGRETGLLIDVVNALADAGREPVVPAGTSTGLIGLRERTDLLGGELVHGVRDGRFRLSASVPWR